MKRIYLPLQKINNYIQQSIRSYRLDKDFSLGFIFQTAAIDALSIFKSTLKLEEQNWATVTQLQKLIKGLRNIISINQQQQSQYSQDNYVQRNDEVSLYIKARNQIQAFPSSSYNNANQIIETLNKRQKGFGDIMENYSKIGKKKTMMSSILRKSINSNRTHKGVSEETQTELQLLKLTQKQNYVLKRILLQKKQQKDIEHFEIENQNYLTIDGTIMVNKAIGTMQNYKSTKPRTGANNRFLHSKNPRNGIISLHKQRQKQINKNEQKPRHSSNGSFNKSHKNIVQKANNGKTKVSSEKDKPSLKKNQKVSERIISKYGKQADQKKSKQIKFKKNFVQVQQDIQESKSQQKSGTVIPRKKKTIKQYKEHSRKNMPTMFSYKNIESKKNLPIYQGSASEQQKKPQQIKIFKSVMLNTMENINSQEQARQMDSQTQHLKKKSILKMKMKKKMVSSIPRMESSQESSEIGSQENLSEKHSLFLQDQIVQTKKNVQDPHLIQNQQLINNRSQKFTRQKNLIQGIQQEKYQFSQSQWDNQQILQSAASKKQEKANSSQVCHQISNGNKPLNQLGPINQAQKYNVEVRAKNTIKFNNKRIIQSNKHNQLTMRQSLRQRILLHTSKSSQNSIIVGKNKIQTNRHETMRLPRQIIKQKKIDPNKPFRRTFRDNFRQHLSLHEKILTEDFHLQNSNFKYIFTFQENILKQKIKKFSLNGKKNLQILMQYWKQLQYLHHKSCKKDCNHLKRYYDIINQVQAMRKKFYAIPKANFGIIVSSKYIDL